MAATLEVAQLPDERCPDCGSQFARDLKHIGYRRHLERRPKLDSHGNMILDIQGNPTICGGSMVSWGKGHRD